MESISIFLFLVWKDSNMEILFTAIKEMYRASVHNWISCTWYSHLILESPECFSYFFT